MRLAVPISSARTELLHQACETLKKLFSGPMVSIQDSTTLGKLPS